MTRVAHDQVSAPPPEVGRTAPVTASDSPLDFARHFGTLDPALTLVRDWPDRIVVIVGRAPNPQVIAALTQVGFTPVITSVENAAETIRELAPASFLLLSPDVFVDDECVERVRSWHRITPSARLKLTYSAGDRDAEVLVRAIRAGVTDVVDPYDPYTVERAIRAGMIQAGVTRERVLAIGAHPDDVEIGCAGTLLDHRRRGDRISILTLSRGAVGGNRDQRLGEAATTADAIGSQLIFGDLPDTEINDGIGTIRLIESVVRTIDPTVVYVHSKHDNHQDHRAVSTAARSATRGVRRVYGYQSPSATDEFAPTQFVNIDEVIHDKVAVLKLFNSQDGRSYLEPELVIAAARYWARHLAANARYAEPFEVIRSVGELRQLASTPAALAAAVAVEVMA